ncbi:MAG: GH25 family lysozyme [Vicingaceae bacterium]
MKTFFYLTIAILLLSCQSKHTKDDKALSNIDTAPNHEASVKSEKEKSRVDTLRGIDVSHYQGRVNWDEVKSAGMHFGIAKATQGESYVDPEFTRNWKAIEAANLYRGSYHFYVAEDSPEKQADFFVKTVKDFGMHHLPPALDLEGSGIGKLKVDQYQKNVFQWLSIVEQELGIRPMIYTNRPFANQYLNNKEFDKYHLWVAEYGASKAKLPGIWIRKGWSGWQFTSHDSLIGVNGSVDESKFLSSLLLNH